MQHHGNYNMGKVGNGSGLKFIWWRHSTGFIFSINYTIPEVLHDSWCYSTPFPRLHVRRDLVIKATNEIDYFIIFSSYQRFSWYISSKTTIWMVCVNWWSLWEAHKKHMFHNWCIVETEEGVTTSRATSGDRKNNPNMSGQRWNSFCTSYRDI